MATIAITWNYPTDTEQLAATKIEEANWKGVCVAARGLQSFQRFSQAFGLAKSMVTASFGSMEEAMAYVTSPEYARVVAEMSALGSTDISIELWKPTDSYNAKQRS